MASEQDSADDGDMVVNDTEVSIDEMLSLACRQGKQDIVELLLESGASVNHRNSTGNTPLLEACSQGHVTVAKLLLDRGADIDAPTDTTYDSALTWACTLGNEEIVKLLLEHTANVEHHTKDGCTALMFASLTGHKRVAKLLLEKSAKVNVESESNKDSPLTFACWKGHEGVVKLLLYSGANVEHRTKEGFTPLMFAALGGHVDVARFLLISGAEVNTPSGSNNDIPMTSACWKGHHDVVKLLLLYSSDIEHRTKDGCTPLMLAAREGHYKVAHYLLMSGAKVNVPSGSENNIPLTLACWKGHYDVVKLLLQHTSNIEHHNKAGCTPLMLAAREGHYEVTFLLLDHVAEIDTPSGSNDDTPLTLACWKGHTKIVELLLQRNAHVDHQTKTGCTPLMEATREGHYEVTRLLLEHGADVEMPDNYGQSPLFMACWKGHAKVAQLLLENRANISCRTKTGITPLFQACRENHVDVVSLLVDNGCSVNANFPNSRENPLTLAAEKGHFELAQLLLEQGANVESRTKKGYTPFFLACKEGFLDITRLLHHWKAEIETQDLRGTTPLVAAFRNGHVDVVEWLLALVKHLPSDSECQKCLMGPSSPQLDLLPARTRCLEKIIKAKKAKDLAALKNAQRLFAELDAEKMKEETKRKAAAKKRLKRKKKKAAKKGEQFDDEEEKVLSAPEENKEEPKKEESSPKGTSLEEVTTTMDRVNLEEAPAPKPVPTKAAPRITPQKYSPPNHIISSVSQTTCSMSTAVSSKPPIVTMVSKTLTASTSGMHSSSGSSTAGSCTSTSASYHRPVMSTAAERTKESAQISMTVSPVKRTPKHHEIISPSSDTSIDNTRENNRDVIKSSPAVVPVPVVAVPVSREWQDVARTTNNMRSCFITVPNSLIGRVIGKAGRRIDTITEQSGAQITVSKPSGRSTDRTVTIRGIPKAVHKAQCMINTALESNDLNIIPPVSTTPEVAKPQRPHSAPSIPPDTPPVEAPSPPTASVSDTSPFEENLARVSTFGPIGSNLGSRRLTRSVEDISTPPPTSNQSDPPFPPYSLYPTWPKSAFLTTRARDSPAVADGKMSYAEAVADSKTEGLGVLDGPEGHPLLEPVWSSGASDSASSSALGEDDLSQLCNRDGPAAITALYQQQEGRINRINNHTNDLLSQGSEINPGFGSLSQSDPPPHPAFASTRPGLSLPFGNPQPCLTSSHPDIIFAPSTAQFIQTPSCLSTTSENHLLANNTPQQHLANSSQQHLASNTHLANNSLLANNSHLANNNHHKSNLISTDHLGMSMDGMPIDNRMMPPDNSHLFTEPPHMGYSSSGFGAMFGGGAWSPLYNGSSWPTELDNTPQYYQTPLQSLLYKLGLAGYIERLERLNVDLPQLAQLSWPDILRLGFTENDAQRLTAALRQYMPNNGTYVSTSVPSYYQSEILQYP